MERAGARVGGGCELLRVVRRAANHLRHPTAALGRGASPVAPAGRACRTGAGRRWHGGACGVLIVIFRFLQTLDVKDPSWYLRQIKTLNIFTEPTENVEDERAKDTSAKLSEIEAG